MRSLSKLRLEGEAEHELNDALQKTNDLPRLRGQRLVDGLHGFANTLVRIGVAQLLDLVQKRIHLLRVLRTLITDQLLELLVVLGGVELA